MVKQLKTLDKIKLAIEKSNPLVLKDIMEKFEKFGTSPVYTVNGKLETLKFIKLKSKIINESELENFRNEIEKSGLSESDFWFVERDHNYGPMFFNPSGTIIIISKKSGKSKEYKTGNNIHWVPDFSQDLKKGFYK